ncbi:hypothetical protein LJB88_02145 [Erysipelotrichaceae bacterium OttesenSCG-928-M19]|nr:hypothetical protein [Erysipelotrichaceae bacterium OttesenSCG-928-M19]
MAKVVEKVDKEHDISINEWSESKAKEFLIKGGMIRTKVTNYDKDGNITSYCITEKQIAPNYRLHLNDKEPTKVNNFEKLKKELK